MSQPIVSSYDQAFLDAFESGAKEMPEALSAMVKTMLDKVHEDVLTSVQSHIVDEMRSNIDGEIRAQAAKVAEAILMQALAGDDKAIRNLLGLNDFYMRNVSYMGNMPTQWALIDAIVARRPDIVADERIKQRDSEIADLRRRVADLRQRIDHLTNPVGADADLTL